MVNIVFDPVTAGSLHLTKDPESGEYIKEEDILCFEWMLDIGYLNEGIESEYRKNLPGKLIMQGYRGDGTEEGIPEIGERSLRDWKKLTEHLKKGDSIRIWYSESPQALCGFFHVCTLLRDYKSDVFAMFAPKFEKDNQSGYLANSWGSFKQDSLEEYMNLQRFISEEEIRLYASHWDKLTLENAPLRVVISGIPTSVDEDFYDRFIEQNLPDEPIEEAALIGNTMGANNLGIYSSWLESRVQNMINEGKIKVVKPSGKSAIQRIIQKC